MLEAVQNFVRVDLDINTTVTRMIMMWFGLKCGGWWLHALRSVVVVVDVCPAAEKGAWYCSELILRCARKLARCVRSCTRYTVRYCEVFLCFRRSQGRKKKPSSSPSLANRSLASEDAESPPLTGALPTTIYRGTGTGAYPCTGTGTVTGSNGRSTYCIIGIPTITP